MATTTWEAIREDVYALLRALTPTVLAGDRFRRPLEARVPLETWAARNAGSACLRTMELAFESEQMDERGISDNSEYEAEAIGKLVIAYPADVALYANDGDADLDNIDDVINADADQIQRTIGVVATSNYPSGVNGRWLLGRTTERGDKVWFSRFDLRVSYRKSLA